MIIVFYSEKHLVKQEEISMTRLFILDADFGSLVYDIISLKVSRIKLDGMTVLLNMLILLILFNPITLIENKLEIEK